MERVAGFGDEMKTSARVVIIGGGIGGCSALYHLTQEGWSDVVLVERDELTSGTTWHSNPPASSGRVPASRRPPNSG